MSAAMKNNPIFNLYKAVMSAQNPDTAMQQAAQSNPQLKETLDYISKNGGNAKQLFYSMAQQKGRDPNIIINYLNNI